MFDSIYWKILRRQLFSAVVVLAAGMLLTTLIILYAPRKYRSNAKLLLKLGRENVAVDPTVTTTGDIVALHRTHAAEVNTALGTMASREILELLVEKLGPAAILRGALDEGKKNTGAISRFKRSLAAWTATLDPIDDRERAILELEENLDIRAAKDSSVVSVTYKTKSPEFAQLVTQSWVDLYRSQHAEINSIKGSLDFFVAQEAKTGAALQKARGELNACKSKYGIVTISGEQETLESQIRWGRSSSDQMKSKLVAAEARLQSLYLQRQSTDKTVVSGEATTDSNEAQNRMRDRLYSLEIEEKRVASTFSESHPLYLSVKRQLEEAKQLFEQQESQSAEVTQSINPTFQTLEEQIVLETANIELLQASVAALTTMLEQLTNDSKLLNQRENEIAGLQREVDILEARYREHVQNREQAKIASELEAQSISNVNIFQPASLEFRPVSPNKKLVALLGLIGSLMSAVGLALFKETMRATDVIRTYRVDELSEEDDELRLTGKGIPIEPKSSVAATSFERGLVGGDARGRTLDSDSQRRTSVPR